jgi:hypothetical protein
MCFYTVAATRSRERWLLKFLELSRVGRMMVDGTDEDGAAMDEWIVWEHRARADALFQNDFLDIAFVEKDASDFLMLHPLPALLSYGSVICYFAPPAAKPTLPAAYYTYVCEPAPYVERSISFPSNPAST